MKNTVIPHKFDCQIDRKRAFSSVPRDSTVKRARKRFVDEILTESLGGPSTSTSHEDNYGGDTIELEETDSRQEEMAIDAAVIRELTREIGVNVKPLYRSKHTQTSSVMLCKSCSPMKGVTATIATSPFKVDTIPKKTFRKRLSFSSDNLEVDAASSTSSQIITSHSSTASSSSGSMKSIVQVLQSGRQHTMQMVNMNPRRYLGLSQECMFLIDLIEHHTHLDRNIIYMTMQKIRQAQTFAELGDAYSISESSASRQFAKGILLINELFKEFIIWPSQSKIQELLPLPFRARYSKVQSIIDCFEIQIQKPTDAVKQALTWSDYKKANTIKYLVSCTPDGIITFISNGFGGRTSDAVIVKESGILNLLQPNTVIMADRGFKHIENMLIQQNCTLLRPPSVSHVQKLTKDEVMETKRIASLRIHVERVIRRLREFKLLQPYSCINSQLIPYMDMIVVVACALINLQGPLIK